MHGATPGTASAFLPVASRVDVDDFFMYFGDSIAKFAKMLKIECRLRNVRYNFIYFHK